MLTLSAKFLITSGIGQNHKRNPFPFEVIDLAIPNVKCELSLNFPRRPRTVTGVLEEKIIIGGGHVNNRMDCGSGFDDFKDCHVNGQKSSKMKLLETRQHSSSVVLGDKIWIVGGQKPLQNVDIKELKKLKKSGVALEHSDYFQGFVNHSKSEDTYFNSTEYIRLNQTTKKGPTLPFRISGHSMVKVNETTVYITGGGTGDGTDQTWIVDFSNGFKIKEGPRLLTARSGHCSAMMKIRGKTNVTRLSKIAEILKNLNQNFN